MSREGHKATERAKAIMAKMDVPPDNTMKTPDAKPETVLLPCPHCGSSNVGFPFDDRRNYWVTCNDCGCDGPSQSPKDLNCQEMAIAAWNTRAADPKPCVWKADEDAWETCDGKYVFSRSAISHMKFCPYCGGRLEETK